MVGPGQVEDLAVGVGAQSGEAVGAGQGSLHPHVGDLAHRPGGQAVPAGLHPREYLLLDQGHVPARLGQPVGARRTRGAAPDDQDIVDVVRSDGGGRGRPGGRPSGEGRPGWRRGSRPPMVGGPEGAGAAGADRIAAGGAGSVDVPGRRAAW